MPLRVLHLSTLDGCARYSAVRFGEWQAHGRDGPTRNAGSRHHWGGPSEAFGGFCEFDDVQLEREGVPAWFARVRCSADGKPLGSLSAPQLRYAVPGTKHRLMDVQLDRREPVLGTPQLRWLLVEVRMDCPA